MSNLSGMEKFSHLEDKIYLTIEFAKKMREEKEKLERVYKEKLILHNKNSIFKFEELVNTRKKEIDDLKNEIISSKIQKKSNENCNCKSISSANKLKSGISNFNFSLLKTRLLNTSNQIVIIEESDNESINNYFITQSICSYCLLKPSHPNLFSCLHAFLCKECYDSIREDNKKGSFKEIHCPLCS